MQLHCGTFLMFEDPCHLQSAPYVLSGLQPGLTKPFPSHNISQVVTFQNASGPISHLAQAQNMKKADHFSELLYRKDGKCAGASKIPQHHESTELLKISQSWILVSPNRYILVTYLG